LVCPCFFLRNDSHTSRWARSPATHPRSKYFLPKALFFSQLPTPMFSISNVSRTTRDPASVRGLKTAPGHSPSGAPFPCIRKRE